jgi:hypothetical protein
VAVLAGTLVGILIAIFMSTGGLAILVGVVLSAYLARAESSKEGAIVGTIVMVLIGFLHNNIDKSADENNRTVRLTSRNPRYPARDGLNIRPGRSHRACGWIHTSEDKEQELDCMIENACARHFETLDRH